MSKILNKKTIIILLIVLGVGFYLFNKNKPKVAMVEAVEMQQVVVAKTVSGSGTVKSDSEADLSFPLGGRITQLDIKKGDKVMQGDILARTDGSSAYFTAEARKDALDIAKRDLQIYVENYETNPNAVGGRDEYELNIKRLKQAVDAAENTYQAAWTGLSGYYIQAPFSGTVLEVNGDLGETSVAASPVVKLADLDTLLIEVDLDQEDFSFVRLGQDVDIVLDAYPDETFTGKVVDVPLFVDSVDQESFVIKISVEDHKDYPILLGMDGDVSIRIESTDGEVSALTFDQVNFDSSNEPFVWINKDGVLTKMPVEIGLEGDIYTQINTEVRDQIVISTNNDQELEEGMRVKLSN